MNSARKFGEDGNLVSFLLDMSQGQESDIISDVLVHVTSDQRKWVSKKYEVTGFPRYKVYNLCNGYQIRESVGMLLIPPDLLEEKKNQAAASGKTFYDTPIEGLYIMVYY